MTDNQALDILEKYRRDFCKLGTEHYDALTHAIERLRDRECPECNKQEPSEVERVESIISDVLKDEYGEDLFHPTVFHRIASALATPKIRLPNKQLVKDILKGRAVGMNTYVYQRGWNACIDELYKLNPWLTKKDNK